MRGMGERPYITPFHWALNKWRPFRLVKFIGAYDEHRLHRAAQRSCVRRKFTFCKLTQQKSERHIKH